MRFLLRGVIVVSGILIFLFKKTEKIGSFPSLDSSVVLGGIFLWRNHD
jgi:hypothetical protein